MLTYLELVLDLLHNICSPFPMIPFSVDDSSILPLMRPPPPQTLAFLTPRSPFYFPTHSIQSINKSFSYILKIYLELDAFHFFLLSNPNHLISSLDYGNSHVVFHFGPCSLSTIASKVSSYKRLMVFSKLESYHITFLIKYCLFHQNNVQNLFHGLQGLV